MALHEGADPGPHTADARRLRRPPARDQPALGVCRKGNDEWPRLEPLLPTGIKPGRPQVWTRRHLTDGKRWRTRTSVPWRDVPEGHGPWEGTARRDLRRAGRPRPRTFPGVG
ncbi:MULTISPECIES: transposase [Streptomyces]|uniref:transposase n=1 Tax=Streptomyces TaxID=1883 RepID=UPI001F2E1347|nr:transposase [Streptomyces sp. SID685]